MLGRAIGALIIFVVGLNVIYFGCLENGSNHRGNPTWGFLSGFAQLEVWLIYALGIAALGWFGVQALVGIRESIDDAEERQAGRVRERMLESARAEYRRDDEKREAFAKQMREEADAYYAAEAKLRPKPAPVESTPVPEKPKPSPRSLKEKAIEDILKGGF